MGSYTPQLAVTLCKYFEGCHKIDPFTMLVHPYVCPAGVWTIGYGTTVLPDGSRVSKNTVPITQEDATQYLLLTLDKCTKQAIRLSPVLAQSEQRLAAITSFIYNLGQGRYRASTLRRKVNEQDWDSARTEIKKWVYAGGRILNGLKIRREVESRFL